MIADDPDAGSNGEVRYSLADESSAAQFAVDPYSGWVTTTAPLDREARPEHRLAVLATDGGATRRTSRGTLVVRLVDYNDCPPVFKKETYVAEVPCSRRWPRSRSVVERECSTIGANLPRQVREDAAAGTVVARLDVEDADTSGAPLSFLVADGDLRARFQLRASGELYVARALDRETEAAYSLSVAATDGKFTAYTTVNITVLDVNGA